MSGRDLTPAMSAAVALPVIRPVLIVRLDIKDDPLTAWTGPGIFAPTGSADSALNGQTFLPAGAPEDVGDLTEDQGIGEPLTLTARADSEDEPLMRQIQRDRRAWRGRKAWVWLGLLDADNFTVIDDPVRYKTGFMTEMQVTRKRDAVNISVTVDVDQSNAAAAPFRIADHTRLYDDDDFSVFMQLLANKPDGLGATDLMRLRYRQRGGQSRTPVPGLPIFPPGPYYGG